MLVSTAYAQAGPGAAAAPDLMQFLPLILIFVVFYFLLIRPQQKKMKEHKSMIDNIRRGDRVVTGGGIIGVVTRVGTEDEVTIEIAEGVRVRVVKSTVNLVLGKPEPAKSGRPGDKAGDKGSDKPAIESDPAQSALPAPEGDKPANPGTTKSSGRK